ncbi:MAG: hypothetical protein M1827_006192 [Pycnora praestabilis]|nr:MAG: hypothetical protein M1827_006192 [Pycnora praestabilis]
MGVYAKSLNIVTASLRADILSWLFAQLPQIFKNYSLKSTSGLSIYFLIEWCLGDGTNLAGSILTRQAGWQIIIAGYYVCVDVMLVGQWIWYTHYWPRRLVVRDVSWEYGRGGPNGDNERREEVLDGIPIDGVSHVQSRADANDKSDKPTQPKAAAPRNAFSIPLWGSFSSPKEKSTPESSTSASSRTVHRVGRSPSPLASPRTILFISLLCALAHASPLAPTPISTTSPPSDTPIETAGRILSWTSTLLYLGSRLPQLYKNHTRRSTSGLSPTLFIAAFFGNLFYSISLLTNPCAWNDYPAYGGGGWVGADGNDRMEWIGRAAPFWLGAAGVLGLDGAMGLQFLMFGESEEREQIIRVEEQGRGRPRWKRVSGWMRGWVPSVSPSRKSNTAAEEEEEEALVDDERTAGGYGTI